MRILVVSAWVPWKLSDGGSLVFHHQLRYLAREHDITILGAGGPAGERTLTGDGERLPTGVRMRWFGTSLPKSVDYVVRRVRSAVNGEPAHAYWVARPGLLRALDEELTARPPAIVYLFGWGTAQLCERSRGIPTIAMPIDSWRLGLANRTLPAWRRLADRDQPGKVAAYEHLHYPRCGAVVVVAAPDAQAVREGAPGARVEIVPIGVDPGPEPGPGASEPVVGFHAAFVTEANREAALFLAREVFPLIRAKEPKARLLLIGRDPGPEILRLAGNDVEVTGTVDEVRPCLERVAVYVAPLVSGSGMKNKVLEAMAAGLPVVTTPLGVDGIGEGPGIRVGTTATELAGHALALLGSPSERESAGRAGRHRVMEGFTWERSARQLEALMLELARGVSEPKT